MSTTHLPACTCRRIDHNLTITGQLSDPAWQQAETLTLTDVVTGEAKRFRTEARLLYNAEYLYIGFQCEDTFVWGTHTERDDPIFTEECVEAFICPSGKMRQYYEINVSPRNTVFDAFILNGGDEGSPRRSMMSFVNYTCAGLITSIFIAGELGEPGARGWSAEYAIPFTSLLGADRIIPAPGDEWRLNLYRIDAPAPGQQEFYAWSPTGAIDYHRPWRFGVMRFA